MGWTALHLLARVQAARRDATTQRCGTKGDGPDKAPQTKYGKAIGNQNTNYVTVQLTMGVLTLRLQKQIDGAIGLCLFLRHPPLMTAHSLLRRKTVSSHLNTNQPHSNIYNLSLRLLFMPY